MPEIHTLRVYPKSPVAQCFRIFLFYKCPTIHNRAPSKEFKEANEKLKKKHDAEDLKTFINTTLGQTCFSVMSTSVLLCTRDMPGLCASPLIP